MKKAVVLMLKKMTIQSGDVFIISTIRDYTFSDSGVQLNVSLAVLKICRRLPVLFHLSAYE